MIGDGRRSIAFPVAPPSTPPPATSNRLGAPLSRRTFVVAPPRAREIMAVGNGKFLGARARRDARNFSPTNCGDIADAAIKLWRHAVLHSYIGAHGDEY